MGIVCITAWDIIAICVILVPLKLLAMYTRFNLLTYSEEEELLGDLSEQVELENHQMFKARMLAILKKSK